MFSTFECGLIQLRHKEDAWNTIASGFISGGLLSARSGAKASFVSAMFGGIILALMEGVGIAMGRMQAEGYRPATTRPSVA